MSDRGDIVVRIGATLDRSFDAVLADAEKKWQRAFGAASRQGANVSASRAELEVTKQKLRLENELAKLRMRLDADQASRSRASLRQQDAHVRAHYKQLEAVHRQLETQKRAEERKTAQERAREDRTARQAEYRRAREIDRFATRTSHRATRFFFPPPEGALGYAKRTALDLARGAGVDFSLSGGVARAREREMAGMGLAQQERIATGKTQGGAAWSAQSLEVATQLKVDPEKVTQFIRSFTAKTGEFEDVKNLVGELGQMAIASGADLGEMGSAAGFVYNQLKGLDGAGQLTIATMRGIVGQTAVGAVEMEDYASQMGRIAAHAQKFKGNTAENIKALSALTQLSIATGGATSAADAARSTTSFVNTFGKESRINAFAKQGVSLFEDQTTSRGRHGKLINTGTIMRNPLDIIKDALTATGGDIPKMASMFADTLGRKPVTALSNTYMKAGGGKAGLAAVDAEFAKYMGAVMDAGTQTKNFADYQTTTAARAQDFQNRLDQVTARIAGGVLPALEKLEPYIIKSADAFAGLMEWGAKNPGELIVAAIVASVARAGFESVGRAMLDRMMSGLAGQALGGAAGSLGGGMSAGTLAAAGGSVAGILGTVALLAGVGVAAYKVTESLLELADASANKSKLERVQSYNELYFQGAAAMGSVSDPIARQQILSDTIAKISAREEADTGSNSPAAWSREARDTLAALRDVADQVSAKDTRAANEMSSLGYPTGYKPPSSEDITRALVGALTGRTMVVRVANTDDFNFTPASGTVPGGPPRTDWFGPGNS